MRRCRGTFEARCRAAMTDVDELTGPVPTWSDLPSRSPWIAQLAPDGPPRPLDADAATDVAIVGAGIAGRRDGVLHPARHARAGAADRARPCRARRDRPQRRPAHDLLRAPAVRHRRRVRRRAGRRGPARLRRRARPARPDGRRGGATVRVERFTGHMGMFTLNHVHGAPAQQPASAGRAGCGRRPAWSRRRPSSSTRSRPSSTALYSVVPQARIRELLETRRRPLLGRAVRPQGLRQQRPARASRCSRTSSGATRTGSGTSTTPTSTRVIVGDGRRRRCDAGGHTCRAPHVVLCTNGFVDHVVEDAAGRADPSSHADQQVTGTVGYMTAFVEEQPRPAGGDELHPQHDHRRRRRRTSTSPGAPTTGPDDTVTLTCMGGPEYPLHGAATTPTRRFPGALLAEMDDRGPAVRAAAPPAAASRTTSTGTA